MSMQARRFWPPTKHKLLYANFIVYGVIFVLILMFGHELIWAQKALRGYLFSGHISASKDRLLIAEAIEGVKKGEDIEHIQRLLEQALQIDPYNNAQLLLGYCYLRQGEYDKMLACYKRYQSIDPYNTDVYGDMIKVLTKKGNNKETERLITEGIEHFQRRVEMYQPHYDLTVQKEFNHKATRIYEESKEGLKFLEQLQKKYNGHKQ